MFATLQIDRRYKKNPQNICFSVLFQFYKTLKNTNGINVTKPCKEYMYVYTEHIKIKCINFHAFLLLSYLSFCWQEKINIFLFRYRGWECSYNCSKCIACCYFCRFGGIGFDGYCTTKKVTFLWPQFAIFRTQDLKL